MNQKKLCQQRLPAIRRLISQALFFCIILSLSPAVALAAPSTEMAADMISPQSDLGNCLSPSSTDFASAPQVVLDVCRGKPEQLWTHDSVFGQWKNSLDPSYCLAADGLYASATIRVRPCADSRALTLEPNPTLSGNWRVYGSSYVLDWGVYGKVALAGQNGWSYQLFSWFQPDLDIVTAQGCSITYPFPDTDTASYTRELACDHVARIQPPYATPAAAVRDPSLWPGAPSSATPLVTRSFNFNLLFKDNSYMRMSYAPRNWMSTGLYAPAGQIVSITVSNASEADLAKVYVLLGVHTDILTPTSSNVVGGVFKRYPNVSAKIRLHVGENLVRSPYGGVIELVSEASVNKNISVTIADAIEAPYFVLGQTSEAQWLTRRDAPGAWAVLESDLTVLFVKSSDIRSLPYASVAKITQFYRDFTQNENNLVGLSASDPLAVNQPPQGQQRYVDDVQPSLGYAHSGYPTMYNSLMRIYSLQNRDSWGLFHELGHNNQQSAWSGVYGTETTVNLFSLYNSDQFFGRSRIVDDGRYTSAIANLNNALITDKWNYGGGGDQPFWRLVFLDQIRLGFPDLDWNLWTQVMRHYRELSSADYSAINTDPLRYDHFFKYLCDLTNTNLEPHFTIWTLQVSQSAKDYCAAKPALTRNLWEINNELPLWYHAGSGSGGFTREWWTGVSGANVSDLTSNAAYPAAPSGVEVQATALEGRRNYGDNYGERLRAYLHPPVTGDYYFWLASEDAAQLRISSNEDPANAVTILSASATSYRAFDSMDMMGELTQRSAPVHLEAGQKYYIEVLHKESTSYDSVSVAWNIPAVPGKPGEVRKLLDKQFLSPFTADLSLTAGLAVGQPAVIRPGDDAAFQLQVTNSSGVGVKNSQVKLTLPAGFTISPADSNGWQTGFRYVRFEAGSEAATSTGTTTVAEIGLLDGTGAQISKAGWAASYGGINASGGSASNAIDGVSTTIWETRWSGGTDPWPHVLTIDTGAPRTLTGFTYLPRQNSANGRVGNYKFYVSEDGVTWIEVKAGSFPSTTALQTVTFTPPVPSIAFQTIAGPIAPGASISSDLVLRAGAGLANGYYNANSSLLSAQDLTNSPAYDSNTANNSASASIGVSSSPTSIDLAAFEAAGGPGRVALHWQTLSETGLIGFNLYRALSGQSGYGQRINADLIPVQQMDGQGGLYTFTDAAAQPGQEYVYWLQVVGVDGVIWAGPLTGTARFGLFLPVVSK